MKNKIVGTYFLLYNANFEMLVAFVSQLKENIKINAFFNPKMAWCILLEKEHGTPKRLLTILK